jgi:RHS repeat-associated protein
VEYDALYRVKKVTRSSPGNPNVVENYGYNAPGALKINAGSVLDDQRPKKVGSGTADAGVPATYGGQPVTLDANGRITSLEGKTFTWNTRGWPLTATVGGATEKYRQDALGRLVVRDQTSPPADYYVYDDIGGMNVVGMRRWAGASPPGSSGRLLQQLDNFLYDGVDHPIRLQHRAVPGDTTFQTAYFELDLTGNVRRLRGTTGEDLGGYRYTAFGKAYPSDATTPQAQVDQPLRWKGRWFNALTGLYDVRARQWSPELGVFVSADEFGLMRKDSTLWGWPGQNPLRWSDPTGQDPLPERTIAELAPFFPGFDLRQIDVQQNVSLGQVEGQQIIAQTNGNVISFSENTYYPLTVDGIASIAHEVTHAYQQAQHPPGWFWFTDPNSVEQLQYGYNNTSAEVQARLIEAAFRQYLRKKYGLAARDIEGLGDDLVCH